MQKKIITSLLAFLLTGSIFAQLPALYEPDRFLGTAAELFQKGKYSAVLSIISQFRSESARLGRFTLPPESESLISWWESVSAMKLGQPDGPQRLSSYIEQFPNSATRPDACRMMGMHYYRSGKYADAVSWFTNAKQSGSLDPESGFSAGYSAWMSGDRNAALGFFADIPTDNVYAVKAAYYSGVILFEDGKYDGAWQKFNAIRGDNSYAGKVGLYLATCMLRLKKYAELNAYGKELLATGYGDASLYLLLAGAAYEQAQYTDAQTFYEKYLSAGGKPGEQTMYRIGHAYYVNGEYEDAAGIFAKFTSKDDTLQQNALFYLGQSYLSQKKYDGARLAFRDAGKLDANPEIQQLSLFLYAKAALKASFQDEALTAMKDFVVRYPVSKYSEEANAWIADILLSSNDFKGAIQYFDQTKLISDKTKRAYQRACYYYGLQLYHSDLHKDASVYLKKAFNQKLSQEITTSAYFWYAENQFHAGQFEDAIEYYQLFLEQPLVIKHSQYALAQYGLGWAYLKEKEYASAVKHFELYIGLEDKKHDPFHLVDAYLRAGDCEYMLKHYNNALNYYIQVRDMNIRDVDYALYQTGQTHYRMANYDKALVNFEKLVTEYLKSDFRDDALANICYIYLTWVPDYPKCIQAGGMLIQDYPNSVHLAKVHSQIATAYFMGGQKEKAIEHFKLILTDFTQDKGAVKVALENLSAILEPDEYNQIYQEYKQKNPDTAGLYADIAYQNASNLYKGGNYKAAYPLLSDFLTDYPTSPYRWEIMYYTAMCQHHLGDDLKALEGLKQVYDDPVNDFVVTALNSAADIHYKRKEYPAAMDLFVRMEQVSDKVQNKIIAQFGIASCYLSQKDYESARKTMLDVYTNPQVTKYSQTRAHVFLGVCDYFLKNYPGAFEIFRQIERENKNAMGAESQYYITRIFFDQKQYDSSRVAGIYLQEHYPTQNLWKARAFLVVAESYVSLGDTFQGIGILEGLSAESRFPDVQSDAMHRLEQLKSVYMYHKPVDNDSTNH